MLKEYVAVDLEMTGLKPARDKILEIGAVHVADGQIVDTFETLVNPGTVIPAEITALTGITQEMADSGEEPQTAVESFLKFRRGLPLAGHNIMYDYSFLKQAAVNYDLELEAEAVDTLKLARKLLCEPEKKTLEALCEYFHIIREKEHRALWDAAATAKLLELLKQAYGEEQPQLFCPVPLLYKVKKQGPATLRQKKYLKELAEYHKIELSADVLRLTRSEASRLTDQILAQYGKVPKKTR